MVLVFQSYIYRVNNKKRFFWFYLGFLYFVYNQCIESLKHEYIISNIYK
jgi:hypothetical protein